MSALRAEPSPEVRIPLGGIGLIDAIQLGQYQAMVQQLTQELAQQTFKLQQQQATFSADSLKMQVMLRCASASGGLFPVTAGLS